MTWVRLDDSFATHPKVLGLSDKAFRFHVTAMCYAGQHLTDGMIPASYGGSRAVLRELVESGLWHKEEDGGYRIHDFLDYNKSREAVLAERQAAQARRSSKRQPNVERTSPERNRPRPDPTPPDPEMAGVGDLVSTLVAEGNLAADAAPSNGTYHLDEHQKYLIRRILEAQPGWRSGNGALTFGGFTKLAKTHKAAATEALEDLYLRVRTGDISTVRRPHPYLEKMAAAMSGAAEVAGEAS